MPDRLRSVGQSVLVALVMVACDLPADPTTGNPAAIALSLSRDSIVAGDTLHVGVAVRDSGGAALPAGQVAWSSGNESLATVDAQGVVRAQEWTRSAVVHGRGERVAIRASSGGVTDSVVITVMPRPQTVVLGTLGRILSGRSRQLQAIAFDAFGYRYLAVWSPRFYRWESSDSTVASVSASGLLTAKRPGRTTIRVSLAGADTTQEVEVVTRGYTLVDLGTLGGDSVWAADINDLDQVVGDAITGSGEQHAFLWEDGVMRDLGTLRDWSTARAINNLGVVVGATRGQAHPAATLAVRWEGREMKPIVELGYDYGTEASAINDLGVIAGQRAGAGYRWQGGDTLRLPGRPGSDDSWFSANAINDAGTIVGTMWSHGVYFGARFSEGRTTTVGTPTRNGTGAFAVTDAGVIAGWSVEHPSGRISGWISDAGGMRVSLPDVSLLDLNETGTAVGGSFGRAVVVEGGVVQDLTDLVPPGWEVVRAKAINSAGKIVALATNTSTGAKRAVLLAPHSADLETR